MRENYRYRGVKGMRDLFPEETRRVVELETKARALFSRFGCGEIRTPLVEHTVLFERGVGEGTDIVNKEMFYVPAKDQDLPPGSDPARWMVLRPEATASVARAYVENEIGKISPGVQRYAYLGPMFRYERPQRGRLRQFTQIGVEMLGSGSPALDAEAVLMLADLISEFGLAECEWQINSVGCRVCRPAFSDRLRGFIQAHAGEFCGDCQNRSVKNPLRLFDCKQPACQALMKQAPEIQASLCPECRSHQAQVLDLLGRSGLEARLAPRLVRGLDYYTRTVFEVTSRGLGAQNAVAAGGRYDHLIADLEGPDTPAVGWSLGVERILELLPPPLPAASLDLYVVAPGPDPAQTFVRALMLRRQGFRVGLDHEARSPKALMKRADRLGARFALFVSGADGQNLMLRNLSTGEQSECGWEELGERLKAE